MKLTISIPIYSCKVHFELLDNKKELDSRMKSIYKKHKTEFSIQKGEEESMDGVCISLFTDYYIIVSKGCSGIISTIIHETYHTVESIANDRVIKDEEAKAYLMGYLGETILNKYELQCNNKSNSL